jgi:hypothetical protein
MIPRRQLCQEPESSYGHIHRSRNSSACPGCRAELAQLCTHTSQLINSRIYQMLLATPENHVSQLTMEYGLVQSRRMTTEVS